jgi:hypothetical protein
MQLPAGKKERDPQRDDVESFFNGVILNAERSMVEYISPFWIEDLEGDEDIRRGDAIHDRKSKTSLREGSYR